MKNKSLYKRILSIVCAVFAIFMVFALTGCDDVQTKDITEEIEEAPTYVTFEYIDGDSLKGDTYVYVYRCKVTDVMYQYIDGYYSGGLTIMMHPDGTPLLYSEYIELYNNAEVLKE